MTARRLLFAILLAALLLAPTALFVVDRALTVYASPEMQTLFLQTYNPDRVFDEFRIAGYSGSRGSGGGAGAGIGFATHTKGLEQELVMQYADRAALTAALDQDMASLLIATGAQILERSGNDADGFHLRYVAGKTTGTVIIKPPEPIPNPERYLRQPLASGQVDVWVRIRIEETWFKSGVPMPPSRQSLLSRLPLTWIAQLRSH
jgi:hypothetical protein